MTFPVALRADVAASPGQRLAHAAIVLAALEPAFERGGRTTEACDEIGMLRICLAVALELDAPDLPDVSSDAPIEARMAFLERFDVARVQHWERGEPGDISVTLVPGRGASIAIHVGPRPGHDGAWIVACFDETGPGFHPAVTFNRVTARRYRLKGGLVHVSAPLSRVLGQSLETGVSA